MPIRVAGIKDSTERIVDGVTVRIQEIVWSDGSSTWEVFHQDRSISVVDDYTAEEPTDEEIRFLLRSRIGWWICQGCGQTYRSYEGDRVKLHIQLCDLWAFWLAQSR